MPIREATGYNPDMLKMALALRGDDAQDLADALGVSIRQVYKYTSGEEPREEVLARICERLYFPKAFFYRPGEYLERDPRYPLDMFVPLPKPAKVTRELLIEMLMLVPDSELDALHEYVHEVAVYASNVKILKQGE